MNIEPNNNNKNLLPPRMLLAEEVTQPETEHMRFIGVTYMVADYFKGTESVLKTTSQGGAHLKGEICFVTWFNPVKSLWTRSSCRVQHPAYGWCHIKMWRAPHGWCHIKMWRAHLDR